MADFFASRPMEDFFINPTVDGSRFNPTPTTTMDGATQYRAALRDYHHERRSISTKDAALQQFALPTRTSLSESRSNYWQGYTSEEEAPSPVDNDSSSSLSEEPASAGSDVSFPEQLASSCDSVEQQCNKARVVRIQSAGRARIISLPKLITTTPATRGLIHTTGQSPSERRRPFVLQLESAQESRHARNSQDSNSSSDGSLSLASPTSTAPSSVDEPVEKATQSRQQKRISRHIPLMEAARAISPTTPIYPQSATFSRRGSLPFIEDPRSPTTPQTRRNSKFGLHRAFTLGKISGRREDGSELESVNQPELHPAAPYSMQAELPPRKSSVIKKLVARGANERAPSITLPPFPE